VDPVSIGIGPGEAIAVAAVCVAVMGLGRGALGSALADRVRGRPAAVPPDPTLAAEVDELRGRLAEVEERLDFAERTLAQSRQPERLPEGR
jgi:hypothetical protein